MSVNEASVQSALSKVVDANTGKDLTNAVARNIKVSGNDVALEVELGYPGKSQHEPIRRQVVEALKARGRRQCRRSRSRRRSCRTPCSAA